MLLQECRIYIINFSSSASLLLLMVLLLKVNHCHAEEPLNSEEQNHAITVLSNVLAEYQSLQAEFEQFLLDASGSRLQRAYGNMILVKPNRYYWRTSDPYAQTIVSNGKTLWIYDPDLEQVNIQTIDGRTTQTPALILSGNREDIDANFNVSMQQLDSGELQFDFVPKNNSLYTRIKLFFTNNQLAQMLLWDSLNQKISMSFMNLQINLPIDTNQFDFQIPEGTDVIGTE